MNIQQIDIDKYLIIPIPDGFTKNDLAVISAKYSGYKEEIEDYITETFVGTQLNFKEKYKDNIFGTNIWILDTQTLENKNFEITCQLLKKVENPISIIDFGIAKAIIPLGNYMREAIKSFQIKEEELALEQKKQAVQEQLSILDYIIAK